MVPGRKNLHLVSPLTQPHSPDISVHDHRVAKYQFNFRAPTTPSITRMVATRMVTSPGALSIKNTNDTNWYRKKIIQESVAMYHCVAKKCLKICLGVRQLVMNSSAVPRNVIMIFKLYAQCHTCRFLLNVPWQRKHN